MAERDQVRNNNKRARDKGAVGSLRQKDWYSILKQYKYKCARCGSKGKLTIDHIVPLAQGGTNDCSNIQPLCTPCNDARNIRPAYIQPYARATYTIGDVIDINKLLGARYNERTK